MNVFYLVNIQCLLYFSQKRRKLRHFKVENVLGKIGYISWNIRIISKFEGNVTYASLAEMKFVVTDGDKLNSVLYRGSTQTTSVRFWRHKYIPFLFVWLTSKQSTGFYVRGDWLSELVYWTTTTLISCWQCNNPPPPRNRNLCFLFFFLFSRLWSFSRGLQR